MIMNKNKCANPKLGGQIALEIAFNLAAKREIHLTPEQSQHLARCDECNCLLPTWFKKGEVTLELTTANQIVNLGESGDPRVLRKTTKSGKAFFMPNDEDSSNGLLVEVDPETPIVLPREASLDEFERLE